MDVFGQAVAGGFSIGGGVVAMRWLLNWLTGRHDRREDRLDRRWSEFQEAQDKRIKEQDERLNKQSARIDTLEADVELCHEEKRDLAARLSRVEGFATGRGEAVQMDQTAISIGRVFNDRKGGE